MKLTLPFASPRLVQPEAILFAALMLALGSGCTRSPAGGSGAPPAAEKPKAEADLAQTTLSDAAFRSLGIQSAEVQIRDVQASIRLTGYVQPPPGHEVTVTAPVAGYVRLAPGNAAPGPGRHVVAGQPLVLLEPVLSPLEQVQLSALKRAVDNELAKARENLAAAKAEFDRLEDLVRQKLRSQQELEQAKARWKNAGEDVTAAEDKRRLYADGPDGSALLRPLEIRAPRTGTILNVAAQPGQYVSASAPLLTIADLGRVWVRVPIPESDLPKIDRFAAVTIGWRTAGTASPTTQRFDARPVTLVPSVDVVKHTADLFYELNPIARDQWPARAGQILTEFADPMLAGLPLRPLLQPELRRAFFARDQMLTIDVPTAERRRECLVPYDALVFDSYGGTWIYVETAAAGQHRFERHRVEIGLLTGASVAIRPACAAGERVVTTGAGAIFSREFHKPPVPGAP